jgi:hypothetical protein
MNIKHLFWIIPVALLVGFCIGYYTGIYFLITETLKHLDMVSTINLNFNETKMVEEVAKIGVEKYFSGVN